jgi:hypothetical protein
VWELTGILDREVDRLALRYVEGAGCDREFGKRERNLLRAALGKYRAWPDKQRKQGDAQQESHFRIAIH